MNIIENVNTQKHKKYKERKRGTSLVVQWLSLNLPIQGVQFPSLVRELRCHTAWKLPPPQKKKKQQQKTKTN